jgi:putative transposase
MWFQANEGAKFWMQVLTDRKQRGVQDILIACVEGLKRFPEAIEAVFPATTAQTCIVHLIRHSLKYVPRRQYEQVIKDLRPHPVRGTGCITGSSRSSSIATSETTG